MEEIREVKKSDALYPRRLLQIPDPPKVLYVKGGLPAEELPSVAVIGARDCSEYGKGVARALGKKLGEAGIQVISGMARGIDGISQQAALEAGGHSFGVLGCGVDICYPQQNKALYEKLCAQGGVLSEYEAGTKPQAWHFPPRNRIVSGLADAVVVVEARVKSGTLITVDMALEQGREVYVVPGRITDGLSAGCNRLMKMGAGILLDADELIAEVREIHAKRLQEFCEGEEDTDSIQEVEDAASVGSSLFLESEAFTGQANTRLRPKTLLQLKSFSQEKKAEVLPAGLSPEETAIFRALDFYPQSIAQIRAKLPRKVQNQPLEILLMKLCMTGHITQVSPGCFCKNSN